MMIYYQEIAAMNATEYKKYHESFMQNNNGSTAFHTYFCVFFTVQCSVLAALTERNMKIAQYIYQYISIVLPLILAHTILSNHIYTLNCVIFFILFYKCIKQLKSTKIKHVFLKQNIFVSNRIQAITFMRGLTYLITVFCILAVDFQDFARHLAKTEKYGYSLMDTGVGLFVLMSGLVHKDLHNSKLTHIVKGNIKFISILLFLGVVRLLSIKQLDYQEHVTEYGVHWNFFFTLAICKLLSTILLYFSKGELLFSIVLLLIHEFSLYFGLEEWVFSNTSRDSLISANREGISSLLGYVSLYLFATHLKKILSDKGVSRFVVLRKLIIGSILMWIILCAIENIRPASRTLANAAYCIYLEAMLVSVVALLYFSEVFFVNDEGKMSFHVPLILKILNNNGLSYFLVANLLTGAINLSVKTLLISSSVTLIILNAYMIVNITITVYLTKFIKL